MDWWDIKYNLESKADDVFGFFDQIWVSIMAKLHNTNNLISILSSSNLTLRCESIRALGDLGDPVAISSLINIIKRDGSGYGYDKEVAIESLGKIGGKTGDVQPLIGLLLMGDEGLRQIVERVLMETGDATGLKALDQ